MTDIVANQQAASRLRILLLDDEPEAAEGAIRDVLSVLDPMARVRTSRPPWTVDLGHPIEIHLNARSKAEEVERFFHADSPLRDDASFDLILLDNNWEVAQRPGNFGIELLESATWKRAPHQFLALFTNLKVLELEATTGIVRRALLAGADAVITKSERVHLLNAILAAIGRRKLIEKTLGGLLSAADPALATRSAPMSDALLTAERYAIWRNATVLILGETGTGKSRLARAIHQVSSRSGAPFERVDLGALPEALVSVELFGAMHGAYTGSVNRKGLVEIAEGGTLFLDEIQSAPIEVQGLLHQILDEGSIRRVGSTSSVRCDVRFLFASNEDLGALSEARRFRADLLSRMSECVVWLPPLRERLEDIPSLAAGFVSEFLNENGLPADYFCLSDAAVDALTEHEWTDNIRGLRNALRRTLFQMPSGGTIGVANLVWASRSTASEWDSATDVIKALRQLPRAGGAQRAIFERLLAAAPHFVKEQDIVPLVEAGGEDPSTMMHTTISRIRSRVRTEGLDVEHRRGVGYRLRRHDLSRT